MDTAVRKFDINMIKNNLDNACEKLLMLEGKDIPLEDLVDMLKTLSIIEEQMLLRFNK